MDCSSKALCQNKLLGVFFIVFCFLFSVAVIKQAQAVSMPCTVSGGANSGTYSIPSVNMTLPVTAFNNNYEILYTITNAAPGGSPQTGCSNAPFDYQFTVMHDWTSPDQPTLHGEYMIYPTSVSGIGISFNVGTGSKDYIWSWPLATKVYSMQIGPNNILKPSLDIRIWKTPGLTLDSGVLNFTTPEVVFFISPMLTSDNISFCPTENVGGSSDACKVMSRKFSGSVNIISGTCNLVAQTQTVNMGSHNISPGIGNTSRWVDASFRVNCPTAYGYGGNGEITDPTGVNDTSGGTISLQDKNKTVKLQIRPYTTAIDANLGILRLDPVANSATGYGIQLAWGKLSGNASTSDYVKFGDRVNISSVSNDFAQGPYLHGGNALILGKDGIVPLSARYVQTELTAQAGLAVGRVEVLASYE